MRRTNFLIGMGSLVALVACSSSSKTEQGGDEALWPVCVETRQSMDLDDETPFGVTAREAFESAKGEHVAKLRWHDGRETELRLTITSEPSLLELVDREPNRGQGEGPAVAMAHECDDFIEAKVSATFQTEDGGFDESWDDVRVEWFQIMGYSRFRGTRSIDIDNLGGSYTPTELSPSEYDRIPQASISFSIDEEGRLSGSFRYVAEKTYGEGNEASVGAGWVSAATWE